MKKTRNGIRTLALLLCAALALYRRRRLEAAD